VLIWDARIPLALVHLSIFLLFRYETHFLFFAYRVTEHGLVLLGAFVRL